MNLAELTFFMTIGGGLGGGASAAIEKHAPMWMVVIFCFGSLLAALIVGYLYILCNQTIYLSAKIPETVGFLVYIFVSVALPLIIFCGMYAGAAGLLSLFLS